MCVFFRGDEFACKLFFILCLETMYRQNFTTDWSWTAFDETLFLHLQNKRIPARQINALMYTGFLTIVPLSARMLLSFFLKLLFLLFSHLALDKLAHSLPLSKLYRLSVHITEENKVLSQTTIQNKENRDDNNYDDDDDDDEDRSLRRRANWGRLHGTRCRCRCGMRRIGWRLHRLCRHMVWNNGLEIWDAWNVEDSRDSRAKDLPFSSAEIFVIIWFIHVLRLAGLMIGKNTGLVREESYLKYFSQIASPSFSLDKIFWLMNSCEI